MGHMKPNSAEPLDAEDQARRRRRAAASSDDDRLAAFARDLSDSWYSDLPPKLDAGGVSTSNANKKSTFIRLFSHRVKRTTPRGRPANSNERSEGHTWLHNWRPLPAGDGGAVKVQPGRLRLQTKGELGEHGQLDGEYRCMAWMAPIGLASLPAVVTVAHLGQFVARPNATVTAPTGGTVLLRCPPPESAPPAEIRFYRDGEALISDGAEKYKLRDAWLECAADGWPVPTVAWHRSTLGARWSERFSQGAAALTIRQLKVEDEGTFICEVVSEAGVVTAATEVRVSVLLVPPGAPAVYLTLRLPSVSPSPPVLLVPPGAPAVYPISESAVMLQWQVPPNDGLAVLFFKIQYRRTPRRRHGWHTVDSDVPGTARSFEVSGLKLGGRYKFRVLAVYENKDNKHGPNSRTVRMVRLLETARPPGSPTVTQLWPLNITAIRCSWSYHDVRAAPVQGYFIHYRDAATAGGYSKVTVLGETTKTHVLTALQPATVYEVKVQAFHRAGGVSTFSPIVTQSTRALPEASTDRSTVSGEHPSAGGGPGGVPTSLETVVGGAIGGLLVLLVTLVVACRCRSVTSAKRRGGSVQRCTEG
ncbi:Interference hedgehog [Amphibalanus amphitrite]|uniref:Interference hedgehog n=1 Tax=Amphibalanus amphitrite TaxID=1232801 RepID=A0A6A4VHD8_AMPAM|nr:Interference hedgehog [Amphibalanus amphitrite]